MIEVNRSYMSSYRLNLIITATKLHQDMSSLYFQICPSIQSQANLVNCRTHLATRCCINIQCSLCTKFHLTLHSDLSTTPFVIFLLIVRSFSSGSAFFSYCFIFFFLRTVIFILTTIRNFDLIKLNARLLLLLRKLLKIDQAVKKLLLPFIVKKLHDNYQPTFSLPSFKTNFSIMHYRCKFSLDQKQG